MSQIPREPQAAAPSAPLLRPARTAQHVVGPRAQSTVWDAIRNQDWSSAEQLLLTLRRGVDGLEPDALDRLVEEANAPGTPPEHRAIGWLAVGLSRESDGDLAAAAVAYDSAYEVHPVPVTLLQRTRLARRRLGPHEAYALLWPHLDFRAGTAQIFDEAAKIALDLSYLQTAEDLIGQSRQLDPASPGQWAVESRHLLATRRYLQAIDLARKVVLTQPSTGRVLVAAGLSELQQLDSDPGLLDAVLVDLPDDPWALVRLADLLVNSSRLDDADSVLTHSLEFAPAWSWDILRWRGIARAMMGRFDDAVTDFGAAAEINASPWLTQMRGEVARLAGHVELAVELLESLPETEDDPAWVSVSLGMARRQVQDLSGARKAFARALELDELNIDALWGLADIELLDDDPAAWDRAEALLDKAFELDAGSYRTVALMGETWRRRGESEKAVEWFTQALDLESEYSWARASRAQALITLKRFDDAIADLNVAVRESPEQSWIVDVLVDALEQARPATADAELKILTRAVENERPEALRPLCVARAELALRQERWESAERQFNRARRLFGDDPELVEGQLAALRQLRRFDEALQQVDALPEPLPIRLRWSRIEILWDAGRLGDARPDLEQMVAEGDSDLPTNAISALGESYRLGGRLAEARDHLTRADRLIPDDAWTIASLGALELDCGNFEQARKLLTRALDLNSTYPFVLSQLSILELSVGNDAAVLELIDSYGESTDPTVVAMVVGACYGLGRYARALLTIDQYLIQEPQDVDMLRVRGWVELAMGHQRDAVESFTTAAQFPASGSSVIPTVEALLRVDRWDRAIEVVHGERESNNPWAASGLATVLLEAGLWDAAAAAVATDPFQLDESVEALAVTARTLSQAGKFAEAMAAAERLLSAAPTNTDYLDIAGTTLERAGRTEEARKQFARALELLGRRTHPDAGEQHAQAWWLLHVGRPTEAAERLMRTLPVTDRVAAVLIDLMLARLVGGERKQATVLLNRLGHELATLPAPRLRGVVSQAVNDLDSVRHLIPQSAAQVADQTRVRLLSVLGAMPDDLNKLMNTDPMPAVQRWEQFSP